MSHSFSEDQILGQLRTVKYPGFSRDIVSFGIVKAVKALPDGVEVRLELATRDPAIPATIKQEAEMALSSMPGIGLVRVLIDIKEPPQAAAQSGTQTAKIAGVKHVIAIASGKGGVGKSTVAANLAAALSKQAPTGLCDCDIYGPSIALMFGSREHAAPTDDNRIQPVEQYGLKLMSMGFLLEDAAPAVLRGPMVTRITQQFLHQVAWGELEYLILDLPPGTGDIQLTIVQNVALAGAIIVTTPQEVALIDARKAASMFDKVNVPVMGLIENMSWFEAPGDHKRYPIFGSGGGEREAKRLRVPLLGQIPIDIPTRESGDRGMPVVLEDPKSPVSKSFEEIARRVMALCG